jgi:hypothetical protein
MTIATESSARPPTVPPPTGVRRTDVLPRIFILGALALPADAEPFRFVINTGDFVQILDMRTMRYHLPTSLGTDAYTHATRRLDAIAAGEQVEEGEEATASSIETARAILTAFRSAGVVPERVIPDGEGGLSFYMFSDRAGDGRPHSRFGSLTAAEDGTVIAVLGDRRTRHHDVSAVAATSGAILAAVHALSDFTGGDVGATA